MYYRSIQEDFDKDTETLSLTEEQATEILSKAFDKHEFWSEEVCN
ncbi:hypothetical protein [Aliterella atlantica]